MQNSLKIEEAAMFGLSLFFFAQLSFAWWWYLLLFLLPDLFMLGYIANPRLGAILYNIAHHKAIAVGFWLVGFQLANEPLLFTGILLFGHSSLDRVFGYGLKFKDNFKHTHLGWLPEGKKK